MKRGRDSELIAAESVLLRLATFTAPATACLFAGLVPFALSPPSAFGWRSLEQFLTEDADFGCANVADWSDCGSLRALVGIPAACSGAFAVVLILGASVAWITRAVLARQLRPLMINWGTVSLLSIVGHALQAALLEPVVRNEMHALDLPLNYVLWTCTSPLLILTMLQVRSCGARGPHLGPWSARGTRPRLRRASHAV